MTGAGSYAIFSLIAIVRPDNVPVCQPGQVDDTAGLPSASDCPVGATQLYGEGSTLDTLGLLSAAWTDREQLPLICDVECNGANVCFE